MPLNVNESPKMPENCYHKQKGHLHLLLHPEKPSWLIVNDFGWEIIKFFTGKHSIKEIILLISTKYEIDPSTVRNDIETYLKQLTVANFLQQDNLSKKKIISPAPSLKRLHLNIIEKCNLHCLHCGVDDNIKDSNVMKKENVFKIVDELSKNRDSALAISGGEPLLHKECIEILKYASDRVTTSLSTNALLINDYIAKKLSHLNVSIQISLDGSTAATHDVVRGKDTFEKTVTAIKHLKKYGAAERISLFVTMMKHNIESLHDVIDFAEEIGIPSVRFLPVQRIGNAKKLWEDVSPTTQQYEKFFSSLYKEPPNISINVSKGLQGFLLNIPNERWCHLGDTLCIVADGGIYPCSLMVHPDFLIGNIDEMNLKEAIESKKLIDLTKVCWTRENEIEKCKDCLCRGFCQANCPATIFALKGNLWDTDDLCELRQKLYTDLIFDMAENK